MSSLVIVCIDINWLCTYPAISDISTLIRAHTIVFEIEMKARLDTKSFFQAKILVDLQY